MSELRTLSKIEQVAAFLRAELLAGRWKDRMPGRMELAAELDLNARTVEDALRLLEKEGLLVPQGAGRRRKIVLPEFADSAAKSLIIGVLCYEPQDRTLPYHVDMVHRLEDSGHRVRVAQPTMSEVGMDLKRIQPIVENHPVDAWIVQGGPQAVLKWMAGRPQPVMAQFGRFSDLPVAGSGVRKIPAMKQAVQRLYELGHRRIVMMAREERRKPYPAAFEQAFLNTLEGLGIVTGRFHLPDWSNNPAGFHACLEDLFKHTPPTAMFLSEACLFVAAQQHLARLGLVAPRDVSLVCDDFDASFSWCQPQIAHLYWDSRPVVARIVRWADRIARGVVDRRHRYTLATWVEGGTIGPAKG